VSAIHTHSVSKL